MGAAARVAAESRFSFDRMVASHEALYRAALARASSGAMPDGATLRVPPHVT
jgi:hypothetical protein